MVQFPPITEQALTFPHFPTRAQCLIYRLWDIVSPARLAQVLRTEESVVLQAAADMGLTPGATPELYENWLQKGYITIIRAVWHLLPYDQLSELLGWSDEKMAYILHEDDFLDVKLGNTKPKCEPLYWSDLNETQKQQTAKIKKITQTALSKLPPVTESPFAFENRFARCGTQKKIPKEGETRFRDRLIYSYCALYGDTFSDRKLIDVSFPDSLLAAYQSLGVNCVWTQAVLYTLCPYPFEPSLSAGYQTRLEGINYLTEKLKKYGIKLYLYLNEPRPMPAAFFEKYPELRGAGEDGYYALCLSQDAVRSYLRDGAEFLVRHAPDLGGFFTITASENLTNCYAHYDGEHCGCPRCAQLLTPPQTYALVNQLLLEGARRADPDFELVAWTWGWWVDGMVPDTIRLLPQSVGVMGVSEQHVEKNIGGTVTRVVDYSISVEGPGSYALDTWRLARSLGHKTLAKIQANNTWEMAAVPCIPVFEKIYRHVKALCETDSVDSLMLSWTLGGYPSPTLKMLSAFYERDGELPTLQQLYTDAFGAEYAEKCAPAFHLFSEAFDAFPFDIAVAYHAPQHYAPANLLYDRPTGREATMVGFPYDDLTKWRSIFPEDTFVAQLKKLTDGWQEGLAMLEEALQDCGDNTLLEILDCAKVCGNHFRSMYLQCLYIENREKDPTLCRTILEEEREIALAEAAVMSSNCTIGYESSNHYFYTRHALLEKVLNCSYLLEKS